MVTDGKKFSEVSVFQDFFSKETKRTVNRKIRRIRKFNELPDPSLFKEKAF